MAQIPDNDMEMVIWLTTRKRVIVTSKQCTKIKTLTNVIKSSTMYYRKEVNKMTLQVRLGPEFEKIFNEVWNYYKEYNDLGDSITKSDVIKILINSKHIQIKRQEELLSFKVD